jgi:hypothetical protein
MLPDDRNRLRGSDVAAGNPILFVRGAIEVFLKDLLTAREMVASAHGEDYGRLAELSYGRLKLINQVPYPKDP